MAYDDYDSFAFFYNKYWTSATPALMEKALDMLLFPSLPQDAAILDLCCGTGNNAAMMQQRGYKVLGADGSRAMLAYAAINAPQVSFIQADAREIDIDRQFDAVTCLFDSVNHFLEPDDLVKTFQKVHGLLKEHGIFVFDVNSEESSIDAAERDFSAVEDDNVFILTAKYNKKSRKTIFSVTMFVLCEGKWQRNDLTICEKYYTEQEIISMLHMAGFSNVRISEGFQDLDIESFDGRIFFTAWK
ncbi:MAG: class I SAM-dependent methyltransferase [Deferribacterales bacterium]|nr:class I SAM-dependent methyltransferase [Deferribacterales bacterium]